MAGCHLDTPWVVVGRWVRGVNGVVVCDITAYRHTALFFGRLGLVVVQRTEEQSWGNINNFTRSSQCVILLVTALRLGFGVCSFFRCIYITPTRPEFEGVCVLIRRTSHLKNKAHSSLLLLSRSWLLLHFLESEFYFAV